MRLVLIFGIAYAILSALAALWMAFAAWLPYENLSSEELQEDDWLAAAAPGVLALAVVVLVAVVRRRPLWALLSMAVQAAVGVAALRFAALDELSDRSDSELIAFTLSSAFTGLCAVVLAFADNQTSSHPVGRVSLWPM